MSNVSEAHIAARRQQILEAARACVARQGFHQTNIQDICKEAELSPGAVYRYFPSKDHIIAATRTDCQQGILDLIDSLDGPDHGRGVPGVLHGVNDLFAADGLWFRHGHLGGRNHRPVCDGSSIYETLVQVELVPAQLAGVGPQSPVRTG